MGRGGDGAQVQKGFRPLTTGVPPPHDGVLWVVPGRWELCGVFGVIKKIWFVFFIFCIFYLCFFIVFSARLISRVISFSACWCPVAVLGCAAMISWTLAARFVPIHP